MLRRFMLVAFVVMAPLVAASSVSASPITFNAVLSGANENPVNGSTATGFAVVTIDDVADQLTVQVTWDGLIGGNPSAAHIHCCAASPTNVGVAVGFTGFPSTTSGSYSNVFDTSLASIYTAGFLNNFGGGTPAGAEAALLNGMLTGQAYVNIHNATFPGGEIRGYLVAVPEPASLVLLGSGLLGLTRVARKRRA